MQLLARATFFLMRWILGTNTFGLVAAFFLFILLFVNVRRCSMDYMIFYIIVCETIFYLIELLFVIPPSFWTIDCWQNHRDGWKGCILCVCPCRVLNVMREMNGIKVFMIWFFVSIVSTFVHINTSCYRRGHMVFDTRFMTIWFEERRWCRD